jgi:hypothetical protein
MKPSKIALKLAIEAKSCGLEHDIVSVCEGDFGVSRHDCNGLVDEAFDALCDEVEAALPFAHFDRRIASVWAQAGMDHRLEMAAERRAFSSHF